MISSMLNTTMQALKKAGGIDAEIRHVDRERLWRGVKNDAIETATSSTDTASPSGST